ncbi:hypothetical protein [Allocoleopsis franciscana]|nr:hypothetical protein [Allocoleopsis franciscana]
MRLVITNSVPSDELAIRIMQLKGTSTSQGVAIRTHNDYDLGVRT